MSEAEKPEGYPLTLGGHAFNLRLDAADLVTLGRRLASEYLSKATLEPDDSGKLRRVPPSEAIRREADKIQQRVLLFIGVHSTAFEDASGKEYPFDVVTITKHGDEELAYAPGNVRVNYMTRITDLDMVLAYLLAAIQRERPATTEREMLGWLNEIRATDPRWMFAMFEAVHAAFNIGAFKEPPAPKVEAGAE